MSLFLSEWLDGPDQFINFANIAWDPKISFKDNIIEDSSGSIRISLFNLSLMQELTDALGDDLGKIFLTRLDIACVFLLSSIGTKKFIESTLRPIYKESGNDIELTSDIMSKLFSMLILDFEFWNKVDVIEVLSNLIFYGMMFDPKPVIFFIPPMSEWDDCDDGWMQIE